MGNSSKGSSVAPLFLLSSLIKREPRRTGAAVRTTGFGPTGIKSCQSYGELSLCDICLLGGCWGQEAAQLGQAMGVPAVAATAHCWLGNAN